MIIYRKLALIIFFGLISTVWISGCGKKGDAGQDAAADSSDASAVDSTAALDSAEVDFDLIPVEAAPVSTGEISKYLLLSATIETENIVDVYPLVSGIIDEIYVEEGMLVEEGRALLKLVDDEIILNEKQAEVDYLQQTANFERLKKMHDQQLISDEEFENARFNLEQAKLTWDKARLTRERTTIRAPISGIISERLVYPGNLVNTATKLFTITDPSEKICRVWVPERDLAQLKIGQKALISSDAVLQDRFTGWVKRISPVVDRNTGTCKVTVGVKDPKNLLRPGMFVSTEIIIDTHRDAVLVPKNALFYENDLEWVYVVEETLAVKKRVKIGFSNGDRFEALEGLDAGDNVVITGQSTLKDSAGVRIVNFDSTLTAALQAESSE
jgi:RND family efflux transporter MFP subunit